MKLPPPDVIDECSSIGQLLYFLVGDEVFSLQPLLLRPYPGHGLTEEQIIFNYHLSRARRVIEKAFGIMGSRLRIFLQPLKTSDEKNDLIVKAAICLQKFIRQTNSAEYCHDGFVDSYYDTGMINEGEWRSSIKAIKGNAKLNDISPVRGSRRSKSGISLNLMLIQRKVQDGALFLYDQNKQKQDMFKPIWNQHFLYRQTMLLYFT